MVEITELEKDVLLYGFGDNEYNGCNDEFGAVWSWSLESNCKVTKKNQISGVVSSLVKKGIMDTWNDNNGTNPEDDVVALTDKGKEIFRLLCNPCTNCLH